LTYPLHVRRVKRHCFQLNLLIRDLVIYKLFNLSHKLAAVSSSSISHKTSSVRENCMALCAFISSSLFLILGHEFWQLVLRQDFQQVLLHQESPHFDSLQTEVIPPVKFLYFILCRSHLETHKKIRLALIPVCCRSGLLIQ